MVFPWQNERGERLPFASQKCFALIKSIFGHVDGLQNLMSEAFGIWEGSTNLQ